MKYIKDMCNAYLDCDLKQDSKKFLPQIFNVGYENLPVKEIALQSKKSNWEKYRE